MRITLKLFATLGDYLPGELDGQQRDGNELAIDVPAGTTIDAVTARFQLPPKLVQLVLVNGLYVHPRDRATRALRPDDELAIWPPIAGG